MAYKAKPIEQGSHAIRLEVYRGEALVEAAVINQPVIKVGTLSSSGLMLSWDDKVSRMHAVIEVNSPEDITVVDLGSHSGTFINGMRVNKGNVKFGDELRFGDTRVVVRPPDYKSDTKDVPVNIPVNIRAAQERVKDIAQKLRSSLGEFSGKPDRMSLTECLEWASEHDVYVHFSSEGPAIYAWIEGGEKVKGVTLRDTINILRNYSS